jgi:hypothetical protein
MNMNIIHSKRGAFRFNKVDELTSGIFRGMKALLSALQSDAIDEIIIYPGHIVSILKKRKRFCT